MKLNLNKQTNEKGVILLAMLIFVFMLSFIVVLFIEEVEDRIKYRSQTSGDHELRRVAYDYLEHSLAVLAEFKKFDSGLYESNQGWGAPLEYAPFPLEIDGVNADIRIMDSTNLLPLKSLDEESFVLLFEALGMNPYDAVKLRDCYFDWVDSDDDARIQGAEKRDYEIDRNYILYPPNADITDKSEFKSIKGFAELLNPESRYYNPELFQAFIDNITLDHEYPVNLNVASDVVLEYFRLKHELKPDSLTQYRSGYDRILGTEDDRYFTPEMTGPVLSALGDGADKSFGFEMKLCKINIDIDRYGAGFHLEAIVDLGGTASSNKESETKENIDNQNTEVETDNQTSQDLNNPGSETSKFEEFEILVIRENIVNSG